MKPILSIIIATKNRIPYCINVTETILKLDDSDFELIIQDNSDTLELNKYVQNNISDERFKYNYTSPPFSSIDNFNAALDLAKGEYVCLIGDDDGINPEIFKIARWANVNSIDAIVPELRTFYWWPDSCKIINDFRDYNGFLRIDKITGNVCQFNTIKEITKLMNNGGLYYLNFNLPKLYHGIVKKEYFNKIKTVTGNYIGGLSPDIYSSVALTAYIERIIKIDYPLTIPGICSLSTSADAATRQNTGLLEDAPHFRDRGQYYWSEQVPRFYSSECIWVDSAIASLRDMKRFELLREFDITALTVLCLKVHKKYYKVILKNYFDNKNSSNHFKKLYYYILLIIKYFKLEFINIMSKVVIKIKSKGITMISFTNIENISQATNELSNYLSDNDLSIELVIKKLDIMLGSPAKE